MNLQVSINLYKSNRLLLFSSRGKDLNLFYHPILDPGQFPVTAGCMHAGPGGQIVTDSLLPE
jgi:hypothetical protein